MKTDPMALQVLINHCQAAAEAMAYTLMRTAHSTFVKETEDFSCGLLTREGLTFASPKGLGATWFIGLDYGPVIAMVDDYREGDVYMTNDPYSGSVSTHSPDMHVWKPVFHEGKVACFVAGHIHNTDMGGAVPASLSRSLTEVHQEGLRIPPTLLLRDGKMNEEVLRIIRTNVRAPSQNWGDLKAQLSSLSVAESRIKGIIERFGFDGFQDGIVDMLDYAEAQSRRVISGIPDGTYFHAEYADEDSEGGNPCRIAITLTVKGDSLVLDFTGSDPQLNSALNMPTGGRERHALVMVGLGYILYTLDKELLMNAGILRPARAILPSGSVVNPVEPAAVGMRSLSCNVTQIATFGVFAQAIPERLPASPSGGSTIINVRTSDARGRTIMASIGPVSGGAGGSPDADGSEGAGANTAFLKNTPVEINEVEVPIRFHRYGLWEDSAGAGLWRGGSGTVMEFEVFAPNTIITARNQDRTKFACWGLNGGRHGGKSMFLRNPDSNRAHNIGNTDVVHCGPGDVIRIVGSSGGGWGDPLMRPVASVMRDLAAGFITAGKCYEDYGVVVRDGKLDEAATEAERSLRRIPNPELRGVCDTLAAFEAVWTSERYDDLTRVLSTTPVGWRHWLKGRIFEEVGLGGKSAEETAVDDIYKRLCLQFPQLRSEEMLAANIAGASVNGKAEGRIVRKVAL